jgi:hypothetical protein
MVRGISEISDPPLVTTTTSLLLKIKLYPQIYKNRGAREPTRGNKRKITDYTDFIIQACAFAGRAEQPLDGTRHSPEATLIHGTLMISARVARTVPPR